MATEIRKGSEGQLTKMVCFFNKHICHQFRLPEVEDDEVAVQILYHLPTFRTSKYECCAVIEKFEFDTVV